MSVGRIPIEIRQILFADPDVPLRVPRRRLQLGHRRRRHCRRHRHLRSRRRRLVKLGFFIPRPANIFCLRNSIRFPNHTNSPRRSASQ